MKIKPRVKKTLAYYLLALAGAAQADDIPTPRVALLRTGMVAFSPEAVVTAGGRWLHNSPTVHTAVLVQHPQGNLLFDAGLGSRIREESADMPWWWRPLLQYQPETPARQQLDATGIAVTRIFLSHGHWDHVSGVRDFPDAEVWLPQVERDYLRQDGPPRVFPSQARDPQIRWQALHFNNGPYRGFEASHDVFGDGSVVLVPTPGHTPGATSMFVNLSPTKRLLLVGDAIWRLTEAQQGSHKAWPAHLFADRQREQTDASIARISAAMAEPGTTVIPTHDFELQQTLGFFPDWISPATLEK